MHAVLEGTQRVLTSSNVLRLNDWIEFIRPLGLMKMRLMRSSIKGTKGYRQWLTPCVMVVADVLFIVEGAGQGNLGKNWGDGTCTDPAIISARGLSDPNPFFQCALAPCHMRHDALLLCPSPPVWFQHYLCLKQGVP